MIALTTCSTKSPVAYAEVGSESMADCSNHLLDPRANLHPCTMIKGGYEKFEARDNTLFRFIADKLTHTESADYLSLTTRHLAGNGGVQCAIKDARVAANDSQFSYVLRSDAKGYYANIDHAVLLNILSKLTSNKDILRIVYKLCKRTIIKDGVYSECEKGIPLGTSLSPLLGAIYLTPLDEAMESLPGVVYIRYMDDWVVFCKSRWALRRAVKKMHTVLNSLLLEAHPDKTFIGKIERGFDFLGVDIVPEKPLSPSRVSSTRLQEKLHTHLSQCARLYEQGRLKSLQSVERYITHWLRWAQGIGIASSNALDAIQASLSTLCKTSSIVMIQTFAQCILQRGKTKLNKLNDYEKDNYHVNRWSFAYMRC